MSGTTKNIIIVGVVGVALILVYIFFIRQGSDVPSLSSNDPASLLMGNSVGGVNPMPGAGDDFLSILLNVNNIKLNDNIFSAPAFTNLHDSSIVLVPDGTEGRVNPFAPIGVDMSTPSITDSSTTAPSTTNGIQIHGGASAPTTSDGLMAPLGATKH